MNTNQVSLCQKDTCVHVRGQHAEMIIAIIGLTVLSIGLAAIINNV